MYDGTMLASLCLCMLTLTFFCCSLLNSNICSAEHTPLSHEQQLGQSKQRHVLLTDPPALRPGPPPSLLHLPIITIPILITASDFIGALAAGKQCCTVMFPSLVYCLCCVVPSQVAFRQMVSVCMNVTSAGVPSTSCLLFIIYCF